MNVTIWSTELRNADAKAEATAGIDVIQLGVGEDAGCTKLSLFLPTDLARKIVQQLEAALNEQEARP